MQSKRTRFITRLLILLLITLVVAVPTAYMAAPHVRRWQHIRWLTSDDLLKRQQGLMYVSAHAEADEGTLLGAVGRLEIEDPTNFLQIVWALQAATRWQRAFIPDDAWLRWNALMADDPDTEAGSLVAQRLADLQDLAGEPRVIGLLQKLLERDAADVRYNALCAASELAMSAEDREAYAAMISGMTLDSEPMIARHAWLFSYYLGLPIKDGPTWLTETVTEIERPLESDQTYGLDAIDALLRSPSAPLRDVGCMLALRDLDDATLDTLIPTLLGDEQPEAVWSGAILSGMTGTHDETLDKRIVNETDWLTDRMLWLGLWMRGDKHNGDTSPELLLAHPDIPRTTVMLALMHRQGPRGMEALLNPRGEPAADLVELLEDYGWWRVLNHYLPDGAPRWRPGGDAQRDALMTDLLRDWYLVHRHRLTQAGSTK